MTDGTPAHRRRIRATFEAGKCIWPGCHSETSGKYARQWYLCTEHVEEVARAAQQPLKSFSEISDLHDGRRLEAERKAAHPGYIYYLRTSAGYKIGWCKDLEKRLRAYSPGDQVVATHEGSRKDEAALHRRFAHLRMAGREWYPLAPDITRHAQAVVEQHGQPDPGLHCGPKPAGARKARPPRRIPGHYDWDGRQAG